MNRIGNLNLNADKEEEEGTIKKIMYLTTPFCTLEFRRVDLEHHFAEHIVEKIKEKINALDTGFELSRIIELFIITS